MELKSDPNAYETIQVTDLDIMFPSGLEPYVVRPEDSLKLNKAGIPVSLTFATGGTINFNMEHIYWWASRTRSLRIPVPETPRTPNAE